MIFILVKSQPSLIQARVTKSISFRSLSPSPAHRTSKAFPSLLRYLLSNHVKEMASEMKPSTSTGKGTNSSTADFIWTINDFSKLDSNWHFSDALIAGGYKWRLCLHPKGINRDNGLSVFLLMFGSERLPPGWNLYVQLSLTLVNQMCENDSIKTRADEQFRAGDTGWGFPYFTCLTKLDDPSNGYLMNDTVIFKIYISVQESSSSMSNQSSSTLLAFEKSKNLLKSISSMKITRKSNSDSSSEISGSANLHKQRKALKDYLGNLSLEAIDEANAFAEIERIALLLLQHSANSLERAILKNLVSLLAAFKEIVPATKSRMETVRAQMVRLSRKKVDVHARLYRGQEQLSSLQVKFSKILQEERELLGAQKEKLLLRKKMVVLELEKANEQVSKDLEEWRDISKEDEVAAKDWIQAREKLAQANLNWQLFKQNLELCDQESV